MDNTKQSIVSFCSGYGGIERGLELAGILHRVVTHVEIEAFSVAVLVKEMEKGYLDASPIWTNLKTFPAKQFCGKVHGITAGYPCQPFSVAGSQKGKDDPRHLWPYILDHIKAIKPAWVFLENVRGHVKNGLREVLADLGEADYRSSWEIFSAKEVGAPHRRERVFVLAHANSIRPQRIWQNSNQKGRERQEERPSRLRDGTGRGSHWEIEPAVGRVANGITNRVDRLRILGNGVVPQQAAFAFTTLKNKLQNEF